MRKFFLKLLLIFLVITVFFGLLYYRASQLPEIRPGESFGSEVLDRCAWVSFDRGRSPTEYEITVYPDVFSLDDLHLIITDISSFSLYLNDREYYSFEGTPSSKRLHDIPLYGAFEPGEALTVRVKSAIIINTLKCLIGSGREFDTHIGQMHTLTALMCGAYIAIIISCLQLYIRKRSEKYLLYMVFFTCSVAVTSVLYSTFPIPAFPFRNSLNSGYLNALAKTLCLVLCLKLMKIEPFPGREEHYPVLLLLFAFGMLILLNHISIMLRKLLLDGIGLLTMGIVLYACYKEKPHSGSMMFGTMISMAFMLYASFVNYGWIKPSLFMVFIHLPGLYYMSYDITCLFVVNQIFSQKFDEAEKLVSVIAASNRALDEKVRERTAELEESNRRLVQKQREKHAMMTNLFHDMRNPLFCAIGYTEMIEAKCPACTEECQVLHGQLDYLSHMTENLFLIAKLEDKKITFTSQSVDLSKLCSVILEEAELEASAKGKTISAELQPSLRIIGDGFRLKQAISNLVYNAIQHTPEGTRITVRSYCEEPFACVCVEDNGHGIPLESQAHLFDRYFSYSPDTTSSGLGLAIAKEIVLAHNGTLKVDSAPGRGSRFIIRLDMRG